MQEVTQMEQHSSPVVTPQALAWDGKQLWLSSRDEGRICRLKAGEWKVEEEIHPPGIAWAAVMAKGVLYFTIGEGSNDERYIYRYTADEGFIRLFACPEFTGSYLSFDGESLYLSQWYKKRILKMNAAGNVLHEIEVGGEISGHTYVDGFIYVLRGREKPEEEWRLARLDPREETPVLEDLASVPFATRSLAFDGERFWSNHRAANQTVSYSIVR